MSFHPPTHACPESLAMKKDLLLAALLIGLAALGIGLVALLPLFLTPDEGEPVKPKTETFVEAPKTIVVVPVKKEIKPVTKKPVEPVEVAEPIAMPAEKKSALLEVVKEKTV